MTDRVAQAGLLRSVKWIASTVMAIVVGVVGAIVFMRWVETPLTNVTIPVLITGQDNQGGQFALGVSRAISWADRFKLDELDGKKIRPLFLNEDDLNCPEGDSNCDPKQRLDTLIGKISGIPGEVPIVVGPLTSTHSRLLVPRIAGAEGLRIPMVLGIPTNTKLEASFSGRVWRLSPTDDLQSETVARALEILAQGGKSSMIVVDHDGTNKDYSEPLARSVAERASAADILSKPALFNLSGPAFGAFERQFLKEKPGILIYVGMPDLAKRLLKTIAARELDGTFLFTDGCIDPEFIETVSTLAARRPKSRFFITFQAPPASLSKGIRSYIWFTHSMGGRVTGVVDRECSPASAATSYEVFGFDSYLMALYLLRDAAARGKPDQIGVEEVMNNNREPKWPFLLMSPYSFDEKGNNTKLRFHVYEIQPTGCVTHAEGPEEAGAKSICPSEPAAGL